MPRAKPKSLEVPMPATGKRWVLFWNKETHTLHASIALPDGYVEVLDTHNTNKMKAHGRARRRTHELIKERGLPTAAQEIRAKGGLTSYDRTKLNKEAHGRGELIPYPVGNKGNIPHAPTNGVTEDPEPAAPTGEWRSFTARVEQRYVRAFMQIQELLILGVADDPVKFVHHIRALVIESLEGARKTRAVGRPRNDSY